MSLRAWLQLFRAQTAPATLLLVLVPYLTNAEFFDVKVLILSLTLVLIHFFSFGQNSLMDTAMGYDLKDPSKSHHPLISSGIKIHEAHNVIHWGLAILTAWATLLTFWISPNPAMAVAALILWVAFGHAYNDGLSKESPLGFLAISVCCTASGAWGWSLSHVSIDTLGTLYLAYVFFTILFQISYSGFVKELGIGERSNILVKMGARVKGEYFRPGRAGFYGIFIKVLNLFLGGLLLLSAYHPVTLVDRVVPPTMFWILTLMALHFLMKLVKPRRYEREKELMIMSLEEVSTIYIPLFILLSPLEATILGAFGIIYFFGINLLIWRVPHPAV